MKLFDAHCHLDDNKFSRDRDQVLRDAQKGGVQAILNPGADMESSANALALAKEHSWIYAAVGVHPHDVKTMDEDSLLTLELMARHPKVRAIGEIGLDYYRNLSPREDQQYWFRRQIQLAHKLGLPIVIHDRDANGDVYNILCEENAFVLGVQMHSYSGSAELARQYVKKGAYISISGPVTYSNASVKREVVQAVPIERLLIETDAPYLTPEPFRGQRNEPLRVALVCQKIAELKGLTPDEVAEVTFANACRLFRIHA